MFATAPESRGVFVSGFDPVPAPETQPPNTRPRGSTQLDPVTVGCIMKNSRRWISTFALATCAWLVGAGQASAMCCPIPCDGCWIESAGQLNLVVVDRQAGRVQLVPNIRLVGQAQDFALIVPTPTVPSFDVAPASVWEELTLMTAPAPAGTSSGCGGAEQVVAVDTGTNDPTDEAGRVGVIVQETVGAFQVTVLEATDPNALIDWLVQHDFPLDGADASLFEPYIERQWVFTAMKLDPMQAVMPRGGWNTNVDPVRMTYTAENFEMALPLMSVNRAARMPVSVYVVDDHRMDLDGFETLYANRVTPAEHNAIVQKHPGMQEFVAPYRWLTRLDRTFQLEDAMDASVYLERARFNREFQRVRQARGTVSLEMLLLVVGLTGMARRARHRRSVR